LVQLLEDPNDKVKLNVVQTIANCAEDHPGRFYYQQTAMRQVRSVSFDHLVAKTG
jgi:hypothetical protein